MHFVACTLGPSYIEYSRYELYTYMDSCMQGFRVSYTFYLYGACAAAVVVVWLYVCIMCVHNFTFAILLKIRWYYFFFPFFFLLKHQHTSRTLNPFAHSFSALFNFSLSAHIAHSFIVHIRCRFFYTLFYSFFFRVIQMWSKWGVVVLAWL